MVSAVTVIGVGIDLVDLERVRSLLTSKGEKAMTRFFSERERDYLATRTDATGHAAARIAAKEAVYKALGRAAIPLTAISVTRDAKGRPAVKLHGKIASGLKLSLSHGRDHAVAVAVRLP